MSPTIVRSRDLRPAALLLALWAGCGPVRGSADGALDRAPPDDRDAIAESGVDQPNHPEVADGQGTAETHETDAVVDRTSEARQDGGAERDARTDGREPADVGAADLGSPEVPAPNQPPVISSSSQSATLIVPGDTVSFEVAATDAEGALLAFTWNATGGAIEAVDSTASTSVATWAAPALPGSQVITVVVTDTSGASTSHPFSVTIRSCTSAGVAPAGPAMKLLPEGYCIDTTEITRAQYAAWLQTAPPTAGQSSACAWNTTFAPAASCLTQSSVCQTGCDQHPQVCVDWCDAAAYCKAAGKRLCGKIDGDGNAYADLADATRSQWYAACTSGGQHPYCYGDTWNDAGGLCHDWGARASTTAPVGSYTGCTSPESAYRGVYDLTGNVWEWEDSCDATSGGDDTCRLRGGAFTNCFGLATANPTCDYPYNDDSCAYGASMKRNLADAVTGFRCCSR